MKVNLITPINQLGYGIAGLNILKSLSKKCEVSLFPIGDPSVTNQEDRLIVEACLKNSETADRIAPAIKIWHQHALDMHYFKGERIGFPIFELDTFSNIEKHSLKSCTQLFVCSRWAKNIISSNDIDIPTNVVPLGVDANIFKPSDPVKSDKIIFFNCGKWEIRKGHDVLIKAFDLVSKSVDNIELWMMCSNPFNNDNENHFWERLSDHKNIKLLPRANTQAEVYDIMKQTHCGIFPSRAEGWNLELLEMMSCGRSVIATNYAGHTEFCNHENSMLIDVENVEIAYDGKWFFGQGNWGKIGENSFKDLVNHMHNFISNYKFYQNLNGVKTASLFNWENTTNKILELLHGKK